MLRQQNYLYRQRSNKNVLGSTRQLDCVKAHRKHEEWNVSGCMFHRILTSLKSKYLSYKENVSDTSIVFLIDYLAS